MDQFDVIQSDIHQQELALEALEDTFYSDKRTLEEDFRALEAQRMALSHLYDEFGSLCYDFSRKADCDSQGYRHFIGLLDTYTEATEYAFHKQLNLMNEKDDALTAAYHRKRSNMEDQLAAAYDVRRKMALDMEEERHRFYRDGHL